jgi:hypothetical protein
MNDSNYSALTHSTPFASESPSSLQAFTEDELMLKDSGKILGYIVNIRDFYLSLILFFFSCSFCSWGHPA